jgi:hypothetical protein
LFELAIIDMRRLRRLLRECVGELRYWHRVVYPAGERIEFDPESAKILRLHSKAHEFRTIRDFERHLEQESGKPPRLRTRERS